MKSNSIVYKLMTDKKDIPKTFNYKTDSNPQPKLIKYGFNDSISNLDMIKLTNNNYYRSGLTIDFNRTDPESIISATNIKKFSETHAEFFEIINLFGLKKQSQKIFSNKKDVITDIIKLSTLKSEIKSPANLVLWKLSDIDIDESTAIEILLTNLNEIFSSIGKNGTLILQIFSTQTNMMAELIELFVRCFTDSYIFRPEITNNLCDSKYLVLNGFTGTKPNLKFNSKEYLVSIGLSVSLTIQNVIQCMNSYIMPIIFNSYHTIKQYIDSQVYEGATYTEFIQKQNNLIKSWVNTHITNPDPIKLEEILQSMLLSSLDKCLFSKEYERINY